MGHTEEELILARAQLEQLSYIAQHSSITAERLSEGVRNNILEVGTKVIDTSGKIEMAWGTTCGGIEVRNPNDHGLVVVGGQSSSRPSQGTGVSTVGAGAWRNVNVYSRIITIWGTPGSIVGYQAYTVPLKPGAGSTGQGAGTSSVNLTGADQLIATPVVAGRDLNYRGFAIRETAAAPAVVVVYDNTTTGGTILDVITLAANESAREYYAGNGLLATNGIYVDVISGAVAGSIRYSL